MSRLNVRGMLRYSAASLGAGVFYAFNNFVLPLFLIRYTSNAILIGLLSSTRSLEGAVVQPIVGGVSDRLWTRFGRRRPFLLVCIPLSAVFMILTPLFPALPLIVLFVFLFSLLFNIAADPYRALMPDITRPEQRGTVMGLAQAIEFVGQVAALAVIAILAMSSGGNIPDQSFSVAALVMVGAFAVTFFGIHETRSLGQAERRLSFAHYVRALLANRQAFVFLCSAFAFNFGVNAIQPYLTLFAEKVIGTSGDTALLLAAVLLGTALLTAFPMGLLADRYGTRRMLFISFGILVLAAALGLLIQDVPQTIAALVVAGVGNAGVAVTEYPLLVRLIPPSQVGVFTGIKTTFESIAIPASVFTTGTLINSFGYRSIFSVLIVAILAAIGILVLVKVPDRQPEEFVSCSRT